MSTSLTNQESIDSFGVDFIAIVMNPVGPSPFGLRLSVERIERLSIEVDRASWMATMVTTITVLLVLGWLLAFW
jgi:hypothetical protein